MTLWNAARSWPGLIASWTACLAAGVYWLAHTPEAQLREELRVSQFWWLEVVFWVLVALSAAQVPLLIRRARAVMRPTAAIALGAVVLVTVVAPRTSRIFYDEQIYQHVGQNLSDLHLAQSCNAGSVEYGRLQCVEPEYSKEPYGYPHLLSLGYRLFGTTGRLAMLVNNAAVAVTLFAVALATLFLFGSTRAAVFAALVLALTPEYLIWSNTAASEPTAVCALSIAVLAIAVFIETRTSSSLVWAAVSAAYAVQFRPESVLLGLVVAGIVALSAPGEFQQRRFWWAALLAVVLSAVLVGHLVAIRHEPWGTAGPRFSLAHLVANAPANGWFYLRDERFPAAFSGLAALGLLAGGRGRLRFAALGWFIAFWGVYALFYAGSYGYGADVRYALLTFPPLAMLAGLGCDQVTRWIGRTPIGEQRAQVLLIGLLAVQFTWYLPLVRAVGEEAWAARADVSFAEQFAELIPRNGVVLTHNPSIFLLRGTDAAQTSLAASDTDFVRFLQQRYAGGVYLHWNFWCEVSDEVQQRFCRDTLGRYPADLVAERRERDYRFALYRLRPLP